VRKPSLDDLVQEVITGVWLDFDPSRSSLEGFADQRSKDRLTDQIRKISRQLPQFDKDLQEDYQHPFSEGQQGFKSDPTFGSLLCDEIEWWMDQNLPGDEVECIHMISDGLKQKEISQLLGKSQGWVSQTRSKVRNLLHEQGLSPSWYRHHE
jgi:RNA polymerase sigma factor (sigma-70 family)